MRQILFLAIMLCLGAVAALAVFNVKETAQQPQPPAAIATPIAQPQATPAVPTDPEPAKAQVPPKKMDLEPQAKPTANADTPDLSAYSYSIKRNNPDRQITPGVTFTPGQSINIKLDDESERLRLLRGSGNSGGYEVKWEKKY